MIWEWVERPRLLPVGGRAIMELSLNRSAVVEAGASHLRTQAPLQSMAGIVKDFYGTARIPDLKIKRPSKMNIWLILLMSVGTLSIRL